MELLTGLEPKDGIEHIVWSGVEATIEPIPANDMEPHFQDMHEALESLWEKAVESQQKRRTANAKASKAQTLPRINMGDLVLVAVKVRRSKLSMTWTGPHHVVGVISPFVYITEPWGASEDARRKEVHVVRMRRFSNGLLGTDIDMARLKEQAAQDYPQDFIKKIVGHKVDKKTGVFLLRVNWVGYTSDFDTDEPIHNLVEDDPHRVEEYLREHIAEENCGRYLREYFGPLD